MDSTMPPENDDDLDVTPPARRMFDEDEVNKLLTRERTKLHGRLDKVDAMEAELAELRKAEKARAKVEEDARKAQEAALKAAADAELSAKELIEKRSQEFADQQRQLEERWAQQVSGLTQQMESERAVFAKEREYQELANYAAAAVNANADEIAEDLIPYITGNTKEEIDASIERAKQTSAAILAKVQAAQTAQRAAMPGVSTGGFTPTSPMEGGTGPRQFTLEELAAMPMEEFRQHREALGVAGNNVGQGRFGYLGKGLLG